MKSKKQSASGKGVFISFEGPECAGKTTQIRMLQEYFTKKNIDTVVTREPGGTVIGEELRKIVKHHVGETAVVDEAEVLLFAASRAQHVHKVIIPALNSGINVICDRYVDSTTAYQGYGRGIDLELLRSIINISTCNITPDITFYLDIEPEEAMKRKFSKKSIPLDFDNEELDRMEQSGIEFYRHVQQGYREIMRLNNERFVCINALQSVNNIHNYIVTCLKNRFPA